MSYPKKIKAPKKSRFFLYTGLVRMMNAEYDRKAKKYLDIIGMILKSAI